MKKQIYRVGFIALIGLSSAALYADEAPVEDLSGQTDSAVSAVPPIARSNSHAVASIQSKRYADNGNYNSSFSVDTTQTLSVAQRLTRLEQQMANLTAMNLPQQMTDLQKQVEQLNGQVQVQSHDLKLLNQQQRSFYKDLNQRINQISNLSNGSSGNVSGNSPPAEKSIKDTAVVSSIANTPAKQEVNASDASTYQAAFALLSSKHLSKSKVAFMHYIKLYPNGKYVENAHYWMGEIALQQGQMQIAKDEFSVVVSQFPNGNKIADARLKLGVIDQKSGRKSAALSQYKTIRAQYPDTTASQLAKIYMQQLGA